MEGEHQQVSTLRFEIFNFRSIYLYSYVKCQSKDIFDFIKIHQDKQISILTLDFITSSYLRIKRGFN